jgi:hypothetical protein
MTKKKSLKPKPLSDLEWDTCFMSLRYAMNRQTISSATLPIQLVRAYWNRWTDPQKKMIARDLKNNEEMCIEMETTAFGNPSIDRPTWLKFWKACDIDNHYKVKLVNGDEDIVFEANDKIYPLNKYVENPYLEIYYPKESILEKDYLIK